MIASTVITVKDILASPLFRNAKLVAGANGVDRVITWVHILEKIHQVKESINGQELILSTGVGFSNKKLAINFLEQLIERNVSCLCIELVTYFTKIPDEMIKIANDNQFPLIVFNEFVRFIDITRELQTMMITKTNKMTSVLEAFSQQLNSILLSAHNLYDLLFFLHRFLNVNVVYVPAHGDPIFVPSVSPKKKNMVLQLFKESIDHAEALTEPLRHPQDPSFAYKSVIAFNEKWADLCIFSLGSNIVEFEHSVLNKCAIAVAQSLARGLYTKQKTYLEETQWINDWIKGKLADEALHQNLKLLDSPVNPTGFVICLIKFDVNQSDDYKFLSELLIQTSFVARSVFEQQGFYSCCSFLNDQISFILLDKKPHKNWQQRLNIVTEHLESVIFKNNNNPHKFRVTVGVGKNIDNISKLKQSLQTAQEAITIQKKLKVSNPIYDNLHIYRIISMTDRLGSLEQFIHDYLDPVIEYDRINNTDLLRTLRVYFECNGSKQETSAKLYIVRQTLYVRIQKLEELLGTDFLTTEKRMAIEFALCAYEFLSQGRS
ncbi:MAG: hypothetical protein CVU89_01775 [Firmicutes bacterium HGW-Firmicutes-14]|nr:MAG: hypothetical protein CVU89_01775 [Firmicutes bacterium HGW-Firmicutes-14]